MSYSAVSPCLLASRLTIVKKQHRQENSGTHQKLASLTLKSQHENNLEFSEIKAILENKILLTMSFINFYP
jgi:hypothetical protein